MKINKKNLQDEFNAKARRLLKDKMNVTVVVENSNAQGTSYTFMKNAEEAEIHIDFGMARNTFAFNYANDDNKIRLKMIAEGFLYHEIGHLLYSQFEPMALIQKQYKTTHSEVEKFLKENQEKIAADDKETKTVLLEKLYQEVYLKNMQSFLNSLEDSAIECIMPGYSDYPRQRKRILACISIARDGTYAEEKNVIDQSYFDYRFSRDSHKIETLLVNVLTDLHEMGVIGYRRNIETPFFDYVCDEYNINRKKIEDMVMYSKFMTKNTSERLACGQVIFDELHELIEDKAKHLYGSIQQALASGNEEAANNAFNNEGAKSEVALSMPDQTSSASSNNSSSDYSYDLSDEEKNSLQNKQKENEEAQNRESQNTDSQDSNASENSSSEEKEDADSEEGKDEQSSNESQSSDQPNQQDTSSKQHQVDVASSGKRNSSPAPMDSEDSVHSMNMSEESSPKQPLPSKSELDREVQQAQVELKEEGDKEVEEEERKEIQAQIQKQANNRKNGKEKLEREFLCSMDDYKNIKTRVHDRTEIGDSFYDEGAQSYKQYKSGRFNNAVRETANYINQIRMYAVKAKRRSGLRNGRLNTSSLYRVKTDQKCFQRTTPGQEKKFRISVLIDESGSMHGKKMVNTINAAYIIGKACQQAKIPVAVWGHTAFYRQSIDLDHFVDFSDKSPKSMEAVFNAAACGGNVDGLALYHTLSDLASSKKSPDEKLIQIIISDGAPCEAEEDVKHVVDVFKETCDIETIGIGLQLSQYEGRAIEHIYENSLLVEDPNDLPKTLTDLLKSLVV